MSTRDRGTSSEDVSTVGKRVEKGSQAVEIPDILLACSQYTILEQLGQNLSTLDLYNLARTCRHLCEQILQRKGSNDRNFLDRSKRLAICDGRGLRDRQQFTGFYAEELPYARLIHSTNRYDCEVEVYVWNRTCEAAYDALPCIKCGINVCEQCRFDPSRVERMPYFRGNRFPHKNPERQIVNIVVYCSAGCLEAAVPDEMARKRWCLCDQWTRWICHPCRRAEQREWAEYSEEYTETDFWGKQEQEDEDEQLIFSDHQHWTRYWCPCGKPATRGTDVRCSWCKRRHH